MKKSTTKLLKACSLSVALLGSAAFVLAVSMPAASYAKGGNDNGNSGGNGGGNGNGGNGNGGGNGNAGGNGNGNGGGGGNASGDEDAAASGKAVSGGSTKTTKAKAKATAGGKLASVLGVSPSELGALNAAHASPNALKHASPNSRVGRIAAYRNAVLAGEVLKDQLDEKTAELEALTPPDRPVADIDAALVTAEAEVGAKTQAVADLEQALADAGGADPQIEEDLATARGELDAAKTISADLAAERAAAAAYEALSAEVDDLAQQVEDQPAVERSLLEAASNKPVTDAVEAAVKQLLGL